MRLFACDISGADDITGADGFSGAQKKKRQHRLAYNLLNYAAREMWGISDFEICKDENGKPHFAGEGGKFLSLSHTSGYVLVALSNREIGADIEKIRPVRDGLEEKLFFPQEIERIGFFGGWTARESILKLCGSGSMYTQRLRLDGKDILCDIDGVRCRIYDGIGGFVAAAASFGSDFPSDIEIVPLHAICP